MSTLAASTGVLAQRALQSQIVFTATKVCTSISTCPRFYVTTTNYLREEHVNKTPFELKIERKLASVERFTERVEALLLPVMKEARRRSNISKIFGTPTWSVRRSLLPSSLSPSPSASPDNKEEPTQTITSKTLHHLLRLSALPPPANAAEEASMLATLGTQLHFVRDIQSVDTTGVEPLSAIRDETAASLALMISRRKRKLAAILAREIQFGYHQRRRRVADSTGETNPEELEEGQEEENEEKEDGQHERRSYRAICLDSYKNEEALVQMATRARRERGYFEVRSGKTNKRE